MLFRSCTAPQNGKVDSTGRLDIYCLHIYRDFAPRCGVLYISSRWRISY